MVMQYLVSRNEEYLKHIAKVTQEIAEILENYFLKLLINFITKNQKT